MTDPAFNLVMLYDRTALDVGDFHRIRDHIRSIAPDIEVFIGVNHPILSLGELARAVANRPTLVFSPMRLRSFRPLRGKIYCGRIIPKLQQMQRLKAAGLPVPLWKVLEPSSKLRPQRWGPVVILKPSTWAAASWGKGVQMMRTESVRYRAPQEYPEGHPGRKGPMIVQKFIDSGEFSEEIRVLTLFGEPLYAQRRKARVPRPPLDASSDVIEKALVPVTVGRSGRNAVTSFCYDEDVLALVREVYHKGFPEIPLHACDIIRDMNDGRLYVLEINPGGNTWHFSSGRLASPYVEGRLRQDQFGAFEVAARVLVERTRAEAW